MLLAIKKNMPQAAQYLSGRCCTPGSIYAVSVYFSSIALTACKNALRFFFCTKLGRARPQGKRLHTNARLACIVRWHVIKLHFPNQRLSRDRPSCVLASLLYALLGASYFPPISFLISKYSKGGSMETAFAEVKSSVYKRPVLFNL